MCGQFFLHDKGQESYEVNACGLMSASLSLVMLHFSLREIPESVAGNQITRRLGAAADQVARRFWNSRMFKFAPKEQGT